jgi:hypothetical protein
MYAREEQIFEQDSWRQVLGSSHWFRSSFLKRPPGLRSFAVELKDSQTRFSCADPRLVRSAEGLVLLVRPRNDAWLGAMSCG